MQISFFLDAQGFCQYSTKILVKLRTLPLLVKYVYNKSMQYAEQKNHNGAENFLKSYFFYIQGIFHKNVNNYVSCMEISKNHGSMIVRNSKEQFKPTKNCHNFNFKKIKALYYWQIASNSYNDMRSFFWFYPF